MKDIIAVSEKFFFWIPDPNEVNEGKYHEVGREWLIKLIGELHDMEVDYSRSDDGERLFIHGTTGII